MILLIDIGNTRIKWASFENGRLGEQSALPHADLSRERLVSSILEPLGNVRRVLIANVAGARVGELTAACVRERWGVDAGFVHSTASAGGVRNAYRDPAKLGVDRWLAVLGAYAMEKRTACVVSIGTAMTIDSVDRGGAHLGGVIVPGPDLMVASLLRNTSDIAPRASQGDITTALLADNTRGAIEQGAVHALAALIGRAAEELKAQSNEEPAIILTGGASSRVEPVLRTPFRSVPDLVLRGLAVLAAEEPAPDSGHPAKQ